MFTLKTYKKLYARSIKDPSAFWGHVAQKTLHWKKSWKEAISGDYPHIAWFKDATLNITESCLDRHVRSGHGKKVAYYEINENDQKRTITYAELLKGVCRVANGLRKAGIKKGDVVVIYMPGIIEQIVTMLACARIGAVHSVVFVGLSAKALRDRIIDAEAKIVITADGFRRRGEYFSSLAVVREATVGTNISLTVILERYKDTAQAEKIYTNKKEISYADFIKNTSTTCKPAYIAAQDPLFILYTSGSTGKPKGIVHAVGGYAVYASYTMQCSFDLKKSDVFWCTADAGWITGHSYVVYGPLIHGVTSMLVFGPPDHPHTDRWWSILDAYKVNIFYTSPTAIRLLKKFGTKILQKFPFKKLRVIGSVGEPLNPSVSKWYEKYVGKGKAALVDTWWQTETGGHMIGTLPKVPHKHGKAGLPFFGIEPEVITPQGEKEKDNKTGLLIIKHPWPGMLVDCLNQPERFNAYWNKDMKYYITGDVAIRDAQGYFQILGRADDVIKVSGHRIGSAEVENAVLTHKEVIESAAVGIPHDTKGQCIKLFCVIKISAVQTNLQNLEQEIRGVVKEHIGLFAVPDFVEFVPKLPKTRSGKIMRRLLRSTKEELRLQDLTTLED